MCLFVEEVLLEILLIIVLAKILGEAFERLSMPPVMGELAAGLVLGPSLLGLIAPSSELELLALIGSMFFMFSAGLEVNLKLLLRMFRRGLVIAFSGALTPFLLGILVGYRYSLTLLESLALATCLSITAIGLSVRVFMDLRLLSTKVGISVVNAAIVDDVIGLILMSTVFTLAFEELEHYNALIALSASSAFLIVSFLLGAYIHRSVRSRIRFGKVLLMHTRKSSTKLAVAIAFTVLFGLLARLCGLHEIVGVFIAGMMLRTILGEELEREIIDFTLAFFALFFFAYLGVLTDLRTLAEVSWFAAEVVAVAFAGKIIGGLVGGLVTGLSPRESLVVGIAMNNRGAVELVIANAFYALGVIMAETLTAIVVMAAVTTLTTPLILKYVVSLLGFGDSRLRGVSW